MKSWAIIEGASQSAGLCQSATMVGHSAIRMAPWISKMGAIAARNRMMRSIRTTETRIRKNEMKVRTKQAVTFKRRTDVQLCGAFPHHPPHQIIDLITGTYYIERVFSSHSSSAAQSISCLIEMTKNTDHIR